MRTRRRLASVMAGAGLAVMAAGGAGTSAASTGAASLAVFHRTVHVAASAASGHMTQSNNWSGYNQGILEKGGGPYTSITGQWVVPTATQHKAGEAEYSSSWIGIGGGCLDSSCTATDNTLIQTGTEQDVAANGTASYSAWWEIIPAPSVSVSLPVSPGNTISANISQTAPGVWSISLKNVSTGASFSTTVPYSSTGATAEWIEETPVVIGSGGAGISAMPNLSTVNFDLGTVNGKPAGLNSSEAIQLASNGTVLATPSAPDSDTDGFNDCTYAGSCSTPGS